MLRSCTCIYGTSCPPDDTFILSNQSRSTRMKNIVLLGSTGSIGTSTIKVVDDLPDRLRVIGLAAGSNAEMLLNQTLKYRPEAIAITDPAKASKLQEALGTGT